MFTKELVHLLFVRNSSYKELIFMVPMSSLYPHLTVLQWKKKDWERHLRQDKPGLVGSRGGGWLRVLYRLMLLARPSVLPGLRLLPRESTNTQTLDTHMACVRPSSCKCPGSVPPLWHFIHIYMRQLWQCTLDMKVMILKHSKKWCIKLRNSFDMLIVIPEFKIITTH